MKIIVKVKTNSGRQDIEKINNEEYKVFVKSAPENNKANIEVEKLLTKYFKKDVRIIKGKTAKRKVVEIIRQNV